VSAQILAFAPATRAANLRAREAWTAYLRACEAWKAFQSDKNERAMRASFAEWSRSFCGIELELAG
jgi:hypothetical protein